MSEATRQKSQGIPSLSAACRVPTDFCGGAESQGVIRARPGQFVRPKQTRFGHMKRRLCTGQACKGQMAPVLETHNSVRPRFCWEPELSRMELPGDPRVRLTNLPCWGGTQVHTTQSLTHLESTWTSTPWPRQLTPKQGTSSAGWGEREYRGWGYCIRLD